MSLWPWKNEFVVIVNLMSRQLCSKTFQSKWGKCIMWYANVELFIQKYIQYPVQCVTIEFRQGSIYVVNSHFSRPPNRHKSSNSTKPFRPIFTISESFQMRYCMTLYLKGHQKYDRSKLKVQLLLSKFRLFNFDLLDF